MLSVQIENVKQLTELLFTGDTFDRFETMSFQLKNDFSLELNGKRNIPTPAEKAEQTESAANSLSPYIPWKEIRPVALKAISGKQTPEYFKVVLLTDEKSTGYIREKSGFTDGEISSFMMNITYKNKVIQITSGVSYKSFTLDKAAEIYWDKTLRSFLTDKSVSFTENAQ